MGFAGMVIVVKPDASLFTNPGNLVALRAGFVTAIEFLMVKHLDEKETPITQMFYFLLIGVICSSFLVLGKFQAITHQQLTIMVATAGCLVAFQFLLIKAYLYAKPHEIGAFQCSSVVFSALLDWIIFKERITLGAVMGTVLICLGGIMSISSRVEKSWQPNVCWPLSSHAQILIPRLLGMAIIWVSRRSRETILKALGSANCLGVLPSFVSHDASSALVQNSFSCGSGTLHPVL